MTHKLHTKPAFHTVFHFLTNIKSIGVYSTLVTLFTLSTITVGMTPAQAELVDLSNPEPVIQFSTQDASWLKQPNFRFSESSRRCLDSETGEPIRVSSGQILKVTLGFLVNKQGSITRVNVEESSGNRCLDRSAARQVRTGLMKPFFLKGKKVIGRVTLPIKFEVP